MQVAVLKYLQACGCCAVIGSAGAVAFQAEQGHHLRQEAAHAMANGMIVAQHKCCYRWQQCIDPTGRYEREACQAQGAEKLLGMAQCLSYQIG